MDNNPKKITIKDVARLAGVSKGTVDRVVHGRGEVSEKSKAKILEVIEQIGYKANIYASLLASKKRYTIICLFPGYASGEYWELVDRGVEQAREKASGYNIELQTILYDQFDSASFEDACRQTIEAEPSAVLMAPIFSDRTVDLAAKLAEKGAPCVFIDSKLEQAPYLAYFGMPMAESGRLGASLLMSTGDAKMIANFRIDRGPAPYNNPTLRRREGFLEYMAEHHPSTTILNEFIRPYDPAHNTLVLDKFFERYPDLRHIITFNSRIHLIADYLRLRGIKDCTVVGYDMLESNTEALREGLVSYLIVQRTEAQVARGIDAIVEHLVLHAEPATQDNFMSMDILTRFNVDYYKD